MCVRVCVRVKSQAKLVDLSEQIGYSREVSSTELRHTVVTYSLSHSLLPLLVQLGEKI